MAGPSERPSLTGAVLSRRWRLGRKIGDGGMGEVYAAEGVEDGARVAIKLLRPEFLGEPQVLTRFIEEGHLSTRLIHPNVARTLDAGAAEDGTPYLVMELLEGVPLAAYMLKGGRIALAQAVPILQGILAGLAAAHGQGVIHRDLKPDNIFLTRSETGTFVVKLLDFGIAKVMDLAGGMGSRTRTGMLLGTPAYMSPEQVKSARDVDARADLWSAGVMFYEMVTGRVAFPAPTEYARLTAVLTAEPEPAERVDPALAPVAPFIQRALRKNRDERYGSALEMARALLATDGRVHESDPGAMPLSSLPNVGSLFAPQTSPVTSPGVATLPVERNEAERGAGGTLASAAPANPVADPSPRVAVTPLLEIDTLASEELGAVSRVARSARESRRKSGGVAIWLVAVLIVVALAGGFVAGWGAHGGF